MDAKSNLLALFERGAKYVLPRTISRRSLWPDDPELEDLFAKILTNEQKKKIRRLIKRQNALNEDIESTKANIYAALSGYYEREGGYEAHLACRLERKCEQPGNSDCYCANSERAMAEWKAAWREEFGDYGERG